MLATAAVEHAMSEKTPTTENASTKPKGTGLGLAFGAALGAVAGVMAGHIAIWLTLGIAIGVAIGSTWSPKRNACPQCQALQRIHGKLK